ncbi:MAG: ATP-binding protein [bacterium]|nr:ATP-binding protein [bacterium]
MEWREIGLLGARVLREVREFVGRRRELQQVLRAFREPPGERPAGVLVHGMGRQGKSSEAGGAQRLPGHTPAVVHGRYGAVVVVQAVGTELTFPHRGCDLAGDLLRRRN